MTRVLLSVALLGACAAPATAAPPTDVADLFPPGTLAFAELHNPAELGPILGATFKNTPLEDSIPFIDGKKGSAKTLQEMQGKQELAALALFVSPEMLTEFRKLGGVAVALTGFNGEGRPEFAVAVLTGDSAAAGLAARMFITTTTSFRKVAEVSKVPVFQSRPAIVNYDPSGQPRLANDKPPDEVPYQTTFAYTPGLFVAGTSRAAIAPVIKRFLGEEKTTLRESPGFKTAAAEFRKPGLFFYANAPELVAKLHAAGKARGEPFDSELFAWLKLTANPKALKAVAGNIQFRDGGLALTVSGTFDPAQKSPLIDFFAGPPAKVEALYHARKPASFAATVNLPEKTRASALVGFLDALAKSGGELGRLPSDIVKDVQTNHKVPLSDGLLAKVRAVTMIVPAKQELPKDAKSIPTFVLHFDDAATAIAFEEALPKIVGEVAGEKPAQPASETVNGVKVWSLPGNTLPWKSAVHFARKDAVLVIGQDRKLVSAALSPDAGTSVAGGPRPLVVPSGDLALLGTANLGELLAAIDWPVPTASGAQPPFGRPGVRRGEVMNAPEDAVKAAEQAREAFLAAFGELPPAAVSVRRSGNELRLEVFQPKVQNGGLTPVINAGVNWFDKLMNLRDPNRAATDIYDGPIKGRW